MNPSPRARIVALLAASAVAASVLLPVTSATAAVDETTSAPIEAAPAAETAATEHVTYRGRLERLSRHDDDAAYLKPEMRFVVSGQGAVKVDLRGIQLGADALGTLTLRLAVPVGLELADGADERFDQLATHSFTTAPIVAVEKLASTARETSGMVNQSPATKATHRVYAVLVTPSNVPGDAAAANQTTAAVQSAVAHANDYWKQQSGGAVGFTLAGTVPWYRATGGASCATDDGSDLLWNRAADLANEQFGLEFANNEHLVLFFPSSADCAGSLGLGSVGDSINSGGVSWIVGTDAPIEKATLAHELGHNLSLGHANWSACPGSTPATDFMGTNCPIAEYGDVTDIMGFGIDGKTGGALSAPSAIRSGLWGTGSFNVAKKGTETFLLNSVSSNSGRRAVVVEATNGVNYFVEFRNRTDEDAQFADGLGCELVDGACAANVNGIRVLRLEQQALDLGGDIYLMKGFPGDGTSVLGRTVNGRNRVTYATGETFTAPGIKVTVGAMNGTQAKVTVTKSSTSVAGSYVTILPSQSYDDQARVGDIWTAFLEADWRADSFGFQWYRNGVAIKGATKQNYTLSSSDRGKYVCVKVAGKTDGATTRYAYDPDICSQYGYGPIINGVLDAGTVSVDSSATPLKAVPAGWSTPSTSFAYQWFRGSTAITGATKSTYTPTQSDRGAELSVRIRGSRSGFTTPGGASSVTVQSPKRNYDVQGTGVTLSGEAQVGRTLSVTTPSFTVDDAPVEAVVSYRWYRGSSVISGATKSEYTLTAADKGAKVTAQVIGSVPGRVAWAPKTAASATVAAGVIELGPVVVTKPSTSLKLTATFPEYVTPSTTRTYQWYRATSTKTVAIEGATKSSYTLTSTDAGKDVWVVVVAKKSGYTSVKLASPKVSYTVSATPSVPVITPSQPGAGVPLSVEAREYSAGGQPVAPTVKYQWYRGTGSTHVPITGATGATYTPVASDIGKTIRVKVTLSAPGFLGSSSSSAATSPVLALP